MPKVKGKRLGIAVEVNRASQDLSGNH
jgi:hypothetical protein